MTGWECQIDWISMKPLDNFETEVNQSIGVELQNKPFQVAEGCRK